MRVAVGLHALSTPSSCMRTIGCKQRGQICTKTHYDCSCSAYLAAAGTADAVIALRSQKEGVKPC